MLRTLSKASEDSLADLYLPIRALRFFISYLLWNKKWIGLKPAYFFGFSYLNEN